MVTTGPALPGTAMPSVPLGQDPFPAPCWQRNLRHLQAFGALGPPALHPARPAWNGCGRLAPSGRSRLCRPAARAVRQHT